MNQQLRLGRYFFTDIVRDGVVLYEMEGHTFAHPETLAPTEALKEAQRYFGEWFPSTLRRLDLAKDAVAKGYSKEAAFDFHQVKERLYHCVLLVLTLYSPLCRAKDYADRVQVSLVRQGVADDLLGIVSCLPGGPGTASLAVAQSACQNVTSPVDGVR